VCLLALRRAYVSVPDVYDGSGWLTKTETAIFGVFLFAG
jgi:hypothetical protein